MSSPNPPRPPPGEQQVTGHDHARQAVQYGGVQNIDFGADRKAAAEPVSIAPPLGSRDPRLPLRGREDLVAMLEDLRGVVVLHGLGGCGKTSIALETAHAATELGDQVWWVSAAGGTQLVAGMHALARRLGLTAEQLDRGDAADLLWERLARLPGRWLLVIDNADDLSRLDGPGRLAEGTGWVRPLDERLSAGRVLVTSREGRVSRWGAWAQLQPVTPLPGDCAGQILLDHAGSAAGDEGEAIALAARLGRLPLALRLVGSYLAHTSAVPAAFADPGAPVGFSEYLQALQDRPAAAGQELSQQQALAIVAQTWRLSLDQLVRTGVPHAQPLLTLLTCFADAPIPYELLLKTEKLAEVPAFAGITGTAIWETLQALTDYALIDLHATASIPVALVHPLVRDASTGRLDVAPSQDAAMMEIAVTLAMAAAKGDETDPPEDPQTWPMWQALAPHTFFLRSTIQQLPGTGDAVKEQAAAAAYCAARFLTGQGRYGEAEQEYRAVLAIVLEVLGGRHRAALLVRYAVAYVLTEQGRYGEAERAYREVLAVRRELPGGERHPDTLAARHGIAHVLAEQGRYGEAEQEFREVLALRRGVSGERHPNTLAARNEIARTLAGQGEYGKAEQEYRAVLAIVLEVLGGRHPTTLAVRNGIAYVLTEQGRYGEAERAYREVLAVRREVLGEHHPDTLTVRNGVAYALAEQGRYGEAEQEFREVLAVRREVLGEHHPHTLTTRRSLEAVRQVHDEDLGLRPLWEL